MSLSTAVLDKGFVAVGLAHMPALFQRLYGFDWHGGTLRNWAMDVGVESNTKVLELGCGSGDLCGYLAREGADVCGVDISPAMIARAKRRFSTHRATPQFVEGNVTDLSFEANRFDAAISASLVNVVPDPVAMLVEMARVLRVGGRVSVLFPTPAFTRQKAESIVKQRRLAPWAASGVRFWGQLPVAEVEGLFRKTGFADIHIGAHLDGALASVTATKITVEEEGGSG